MPTYENDVLMQRKQGNDMHIDYPVTRYHNVLDAPIIYNSFQEVNAGYTQTTALRTVMTAMALNSELHANVTAKTADYPAAGTLHITKTVANTASMIFDSATDKYYANVTPTTIEQIFGGGGKIWKLLIDDLEFTTLENEMTNVKKSVADGKGLVATAISAKGIATTETDTFATMAGNVDKIITLGQGTGDGTAIANQILSGLVAYAKGKRLIGTMADNGAVSKSLAINGTYTIPAGYHNGLGKVTQSITTKAAQTYTPTTANQTIGAGQYLSGAQTIAGSGNLVPGNIKQGVNLFGVVGTLQEVKFKSGRGTIGTDERCNIDVGFKPTIVIVQSSINSGYVETPFSSMVGYDSGPRFTISGTVIQVVYSKGRDFQWYAIG